MNKELYKTIDDLAKSIKEELGILHENYVDLEKVLNLVEIDVITNDYFSNTTKKKNVIIVETLPNYNDPTDRQRIAIKLGEQLLTKDVPLHFYDKHIININFAQCLLMPYDKFTDEFFKQADGNEIDLNILEKIFGVPVLEITQYAQSLKYIY